MDFSELKKIVKENVPIQEPDFIRENDDSLNVGFLEINSTQKVIFSISVFKGKKYFDIRVWIQAESGEWTPTKKGIHLAFDRFTDFEKLVQLISQSLSLDQ